MAIIINADTKICGVVREYLQSNNMADLCSFIEEKDAETLTISNGYQENKYSLPLRLGELIDQLHKYKNSKNNVHDYIYFKGGCSLDLQHGIFTSEDSKKESLTEKTIILSAYFTTFRTIITEVTDTSFWLTCTRTDITCVWSPLLKVTMAKVKERVMNSL